MTRRRRRLGAAHLAFFGVGICAAPADAGPPQTFVTLEYSVSSAAGACPAATEFRRSVGRQLGYDPFRADADRRVTVEITRSPSGLEGRLGWSDAEGGWVGDRRFSSRKADCAELAASMMFSTAVQIQLLAALSPPAPPAPAAVAEAKSLAPPPTAIQPAPVATPPSPPGPRVVFGAGIGAALAVGVAPGPGALARLFIGARRGRLSLEVAADVTLPVTEQGPDSSAFAVETQAADVTGCGHLGALAGCLVGRFGRIQARGSGVDVPRSPSGWFSQAGVRLAAARDLGGRLFAGAHVDGLVMLSPWTVALNDSGVWTTPRLGLLLGVDLGARFF